ncbi:MAG: hypothetical protein JO185_20385 [Acidobacteriaceae bacterium]|nr:hypothetical protein [Acidobacteriaceae bacterium]
MSEKGLNRGLHFQALDWAAYAFLLLWAIFDKKLRNNLRTSRRELEQGR